MVWWRNHGIKNIGVDYGEDLSKFPVELSVALLVNEGSSCSSITSASIKSSWRFGLTAFATEGRGGKLGLNDEVEVGIGVLGRGTLNGSVRTGTGRDEPDDSREGVFAGSAGVDGRGKP